VFCDVRQRAPEPAAGELKRDRLKRPGVFILRAHPGLPEGEIGGPLLQHACQFERMHRTGVVPQNVAEHMQGGKCNPVGLGERWDRPPFYCECRSPIPGWANVRYPDTVASVVPDAAMQFDGDGKIGIEVISAPLPGEWLDQWSCVLV